MAAINHTPPNPDPAVPLPHKVARLNGYQRVAEGPGKSLHVMPGDRVRVEVFVKYLNLRQDEGIGAAALLSYLLGAATGFVQVPLDGGAFKITKLDGIGAGLSAILGGTGEGGTAPQAYLNAYWLNESGDLASAQHKNAPVTKAAAIKPTTVTDAHERLFFEWVIDKPGDLYINVSHEAVENIDVYFDDLHIEHVYSPIVAGSDFYPFGLEMADRHLTREKYRYGYQGKYAEKDSITGWNHFQLREYDNVIGRWTSKDPKGQFFSPYVGMGNNPITNTDPDGGWIKYTGTRQERRELRQLYREMRRNSDDFKRDFNKLRFSFKRHDIEAVADRTNFTGYAANQEKFNSNPHPPESMEAHIYNLKIKVMYSGVSGVIETSKNGRTTTFIALEYHKNNPDAPSPTGKIGLLPTLAHEFNHSYNHHMGLSIQDYEAAAVDYQNKIMLQIGKSTGIKYDFRKNYDDD
jgi:RHS repeat-associated protein